jgi:hypothetical protein
VDGTNGPADCNLEAPCDDTHSVAQGCPSSISCIITEDSCGTEYVCIDCPAADPSLSSDCGPPGSYCSVPWTDDPYCWTQFTCGSDGKWRGAGDICE